MKIKTRKHKVKNLLYDPQIKNKLELDRKENIFDKQYINNDLLKVPKILYDSDWVLAEWTEGIPTSSVYITADEFSDKEGTELPLNINYDFQKEWRIPQEYLPFVKPTIMIDPITPDLKIYGMIPRLTYWQWKSNYKQIKGDSTLIYKGYNVGSQFSTYPQSDITDNNILEDLTSKWYKAEIEWTQNDGIERKIVDGWITYINISYNFTHTVYLGETCLNWNYEYFSVPAFDSLSDNSVNGQGNWGESMWVGSGTPPSHIWTHNSNSEKNVIKTVDILGTNSTQIFAKGSYYEKEAGDWVYKGIQEKWAFHGLAYSPPSDNPAFEITRLVITRAENTSGEDLFRLWYSDKRARYFSGYDDFSWLLQNTPEDSDYETGTLPYTKLTYEVNPEPYPIEEYPGWEQKGFSIDRVSITNPSTWVKTSLSRYGLKASGTIYATAPAKLNEQVDTIWWVDEEYNHDGSNYSRDSANRDNDKIRNRFVVEPQEAKVRFQLVCTNPIYYEQVRKYIN